ncbi:MAG: aminotransferase class I/II-fold pyridoxal phosphate-dependent enzyme [Candidatus Competibacteraceae bacterium]|nr:aminotransferase class I/II-fold pyridoxal phosphate-dependent enzyme [Candidatus Competibacteraceae bacterium]
MSKRPNLSSAPDIHLNLNVRGLKPSATLAINERSAQLIREGRKIYRFGLGQSPFPVPQPVVEELRAHAHQKDYLAVRGLWPLREAVAGYHHRLHGVECSGEDVLIGPGSKELMFILQLVYYGDLVIPTPSWVSYAPQAKIIGRQIHWASTHPENDWRLMPEELDRLCRDDPQRPRIVILNYPGNPTGDTYTVDELKALARVAKKYKVILVSDEIYGELHFRGQHVSIARFYPEGTIISGGLSKWCGAGGWRLGTFTFPRNLRWLLDAMAVVASETFTATSAPIQYAAVRAFEGGMEIEQYLAQSRRILRHLGGHVWRRLKASGARVSEPVGAFYLFPDFSPVRERLAARNIHDSAALSERLLEEAGVATLPGADFGRPPEELTLRLAYVDFDGSRALVAAQQTPIDQELDKSFLELYCPNVVQAMDAMVKWLEEPSA